MNDNSLLPFNLPAVARKKVSAAFDGGRITSDGGVMLLAQAERRLGIADQLARVIPDERDADRVVHLLPDIRRARIFAIACGYEDDDDLDRLRSDPALKLACGRLPDTGRLVFRPIQKVLLATVDRCSYQKFRHTGEGRCPWQRWVPAFAGKTRRGVALNHSNGSKH